MARVGSIGGNGEYSKTQGGKEFSCSPDKSGFLVLVSILKETSSGPSRFYSSLLHRLSAKVDKRAMSCLQSL